MGCDIHSRVHVFKDGVWRVVQYPLFPPPWLGDRLFSAKIERCYEPCAGPFSWRSYGMFAFLAGVRNYSHVPPISDLRGIPADLASDCPDDYYVVRDDYSFSWLGLQELLAFDYSQTFEDRRCMRDGNGAADAGKGFGKVVTFREFLGSCFFRDLAIMRSLADDPETVRVVFGFGN